MSLATSGINSLQTSSRVKEKPRPKISDPIQHPEFDDKEAFKRISKLADYSRSIMSHLIECDTSEFEDAGIKFEVKELPSDLIESPQIRFKQKPDREDPRAEEQACIGVEMKLKEFRANLDEIVADYKLKNAVDDKKTALIRKLADLYKDIDVAIREKENKDYKSYQATVQALIFERDATYAKLKEEEMNGNDRIKLSKLNIRLLRTLRLLVKVEIMKAGMVLNGRAKGLRGQAACMVAQGILAGTSENIDFLKRELNFRALRLEHAPKIRQMKITDGGGEEVWSTNLENFDIEFSRSADSFDSEPKVKIRQRRWIVVPRMLVSVRRDVKRGDLDQARKRLDLLIRLYSLSRIRMMESYKGISSDLRKLRNVISDLPNGVVPSSEKIKSVVEKVRDLTGVPGVTEPKVTCRAHWILDDVEYKSLPSGTKGQLEALAENRSDYSLILQNKALIEEYISLLNQAVKKSHLTKKKRDLITVGIENLAVWTKRGLVYPKQFATIDFSPVIVLINAGFELEDKNQNDANELYLRAASNLNEAVTQLNSRLSELGRISSGVKGRTDALYAEFRDRDISERITVSVESCKKRNYTEALKQISAIRSRYFAFPLVEPGYIRANSLLGEIETLIQRTARIKNGDLPVEKLALIEAKTNMLEFDLKHKYSYRVLIHSIKAGESRYRFVNPGTTLAGLLAMLQINPGTAFVSLGNGKIQNSELRDIKLSDETPTICISKTPPLKGYRAGKKGNAYSVVA